MARPLETILEEIVRVAEELDVNPRNLRRTEFLPNSEVTKHDLEVYGGFSKLRTDAAHVHGVDNHKDMSASRGVELRNSYVRKLERTVATADYLSEKLLTGMVDIFEKHPIVLPTTHAKPKKVKKQERMLTLLWSDLHFGLDVDPREVYSSEFNWRIAARRMAKCCLQAASWKPEYRENTTLQVVLNGDILAGIIHLSEANIKEIQEQIWGATAILSHALGFLRQHFSKINVLCLPGNHDRETYRSSERAVSQRWNSYAHSVFMGLKIWFRADKSVFVDVPMSGMGSYETPGGHLVFASHGDTEPSTSNVGKSFDVEKTTKALLKLNSSNTFSKKIEVVLFGHWHQPSMFMLPDGTTCIVNGALIGSDPFAQNGVGFFNSMPAQVMFESVPGFPVGDFRVVQLRDADLDESLDKIINIPGLERGGLIDFC
jgi:predicted phosphodiesterase